MRTASVRDLRQDFPRILEWINAGEEVAITKRNQTVARLVPWAMKKAGRRPMPDIAGRLKKVFGGKVIPDKTMKRIMDHSRGTF
jgi:prevent-host-death family protein